MLLLAFLLLYFTCYTISCSGRAHYHLLTLDASNVLMVEFGDLEGFFSNLCDSVVVRHHCTGTNGNL